MIGQAMGSILVCLELLYVSPSLDLLCDTQGLAWGYKFMRFLAPTLILTSYTHYPIISSVSIYLLSLSVFLSPIYFY